MALTLIVINTVILIIIFIGLIILGFVAEKYIRNLFQNINKDVKEIKSNVNSFKSEIDNIKDEINNTIIPDVNTIKNNVQQLLQRTA
jgi:Sec-independent protein translocase protein TatA